MAVVGEQSDCVVRPSFAPLEVSVLTDRRGESDGAVVREWKSLCKTAKLHPEVFWSARTVYLRYIRWSGELVPGGQDAVERLRERRLRAHICAPMTLHLNKRKGCALGDEHPGCCPGQCKRTAQLALNC